jgi:Mn2+/Fe2+ NRAMP family transporter
MLKLLGPGLLYAAAAIGVSHVVQSTRAGADFGYQLIWAVILANLIKYPFFKVGPKYTAITGKSLLDGYRKMGVPVIVLFLILTLLTMFVVQAAVTIVTAGIVQSILDQFIHIKYISMGILIVCYMILFKDKYKILDNFIKVIVIILSLSTIVALIFSLFGDIPKNAPANIFQFSDKTHILFLVALIGWMPAPMDIPIWHSVWCMADNEEKKTRTSLKDAIFDFNIGYIGTAVLALCFVSLGSAIMYQSGESFASSGGEFAGQVIALYTKALGPWAYFIIAIATFSTMFSTTLTCLDAFARISSEGCYQLTLKPFFQQKQSYKIWLMITIFGATCINIFFLKNMRALVDFATTLSFIVSPFFAILNFKVMQSEEIAQEHHFKGWEKYLAYFGILFLSLFAIYYLYISNIN